MRDECLGFRLCQDVVPPLGACLNGKVVQKPLVQDASIRGLPRPDVNASDGEGVFDHGRGGSHILLGGQSEGSVDVGVQGEARKRAGVAFVSSAVGMRLVAGHRMRGSCSSACFASHSRALDYSSHYCPLKLAGVTWTLLDATEYRLKPQTSIGYLLLKPVLCDLNDVIGL